MEIGLSSARLEVRCSLASQEKRGREQWCVFLFTRLDSNDIVDIHFWDTISKASGLFGYLAVFARRFIEYCSGQGAVY